MSSTDHEMPFLDHLEELRQRLLRIIAVLMGVAIVSYLFSDHIIDFLTRPYYAQQNTPLIFLAPAEGFLVQVKVSIFTGVVLSLPVIFYQLWQFIAPGLLNKEKKHLLPVAMFSTLCFTAGASFAYYVIIPYGLKFLMNFQTESLAANITIRDYLSFVTLLVLVFGLVFQLPILAFFFAKIGLLTPEFMREKRAYAIVIIAIVAAILTPPDPFTQIAMALPLVVLYELSIWICKWSLPKSDLDE